MTFRASFLAAAILALVSGLVFHFAQRQISGPLFTALGTQPDVLAVLERSLDDQRELARHRPEHAPVLRRRFEDTSTLVSNLRVLDHNREGIEQRFEQILLALFAGAVVVVVGGVAMRQSRHEARLARLQDALTDLAAGRTDIAIGDRHRDTLGRIGRMIEATSRRMAHDRRRLRTLQNLSAWQEAARRHAHEIRTPLTGARLEVEKLDGLLAGEPLNDPRTIHAATRSIVQELERLGRFTQEFTSFARLPHPRREPCDLWRLIEEFVTTFDAAWPNLELVLTPADEPVELAVDRDMIRRVLVNLCDNASLAIASRGGDTGTAGTGDGATGKDGAGTVTFTLDPAAHAAGGTVALDVADDGPGVAPAVRARLFEPYTTTRTIGQGMGLGLAISKKILLDHDGDLELLSTSPHGTTFRLTFHRTTSDDEPRASQRETQT